MRRSSWLPVLLLLAGCASTQDTPARPGGAPLPVRSSAAPPVVLTSAEPAPVLGPTGLGGLQLGMAKGDAMVSGELTQVPGEVGGTACAQYQLIKFPSTDGGYQVGASGTRGVEVIFAPPGVSTPEGIHLGSTLREARSAYPKLGSGGDFLRTPVPGQPDYVYLVGTGGGDTVVALALMLRDQTCIN